MDYFSRAREAQHLGLVAVGLAGFGIMLCSLGSAAGIAIGMRAFDLLAPGHGVWGFDLVLTVCVALLVFALGLGWVRLRNLGRHGLGGASEARRFGARPHDDPSGLIRSTLEEFAVAAGAPVPRVFVIEEADAINAFAVGVEPSDAAIVVTRGALDELSAGEVRALLAHEFVRIVDGDMALALRVSIATESLLVPSMLGRWCAIRRAAWLRVLLFVPRVLFGTVGFPGWVLARATKSVLWHRRGAGADADSLVFAGDPHGLASLLARAVPDADGCRADLSAPRALEFDHALLAPMSSWWVARLSRLRTHQAPIDRERTIGLAHAQIGADVSYAQANLPQVKLPADEVFARFTEFEASHARRASRLLAAIPDGLRAALRRPVGCHALICVLLTRGSSKSQRAQLRMFSDRGCPSAVLEARDLHGLCDELDQATWVALADIAQPAVLTMSQQRLERFEADLVMLANGDTDSFTFFVAHVWLRHVRSIRSLRTGGARSQLFGRGRPISRNSWSDIIALLLTVARVGNWDASVARRAFGDACRTVDVPAGQRVYSEIDSRVVEYLHRSMPTLDRLTISAKRKLAHACLLACAGDALLEPREVERIRAIARAFGCVVPPVLDLASKPGPTPSTDFSRALAEIWHDELAAMAAGS